MGGRGAHQLEGPRRLARAPPASTPGGGLGLGLILRSGTGAPPALTLKLLSSVCLMMALSFLSYPHCFTPGCDRTPFLTVRTSEPTLSSVLCPTSRTPQP